ncbi:MAG: hypothetical protein LAO24_17935 [Acidobacteriia bacterium]|nr:hypothetical protein [Terriglobia bacterium]
MTQNRTDLHTCGICSQSFNSERELQEHQSSAHNRPVQGEKQPDFERKPKGGPDQDEQKKEKIA